ncbi:MAG: hypothetical protein WBB36_07810 [Chitinophagales bacterium]
MKSIIAYHKSGESSKQRDYRNVVIAQAILVSIALLLEDMVNLFGMGAERQMFYSVFLMLGAVYYYMLWDLVRNFVQQPVIVYGILLVMLFGFLTLFIAEFPFGKIVNDPSSYLITVHTLLFLTEIFVMYHAFRDVFRKDEVSYGKLWGSVSLFIMMAIAFASIYDILSILQPGSFGIALEPGFPSFSESLYFSVVTISGGVPDFSEVSHFIRDIAALEAVLGALYLVILIGRIIARV